MAFEPAFRTSLHGFPQLPEEEQPEQGFLSRMAQAAGQELIRPLETYGRTLAEGVYQGSRFIYDPTFRKAILDPESITETERAMLEAAPETMFLAPEQVKNRKEIAKTGLGSTVQTMATLYGAPRVATMGGLATLGIGAGLGGGISKATGQDVATGMGRGIGAAPQLLGYTRATDPTIYKALQPFAATGGVKQLVTSPLSREAVTSRLASGAVNVLQGKLIDQARQQETTPAWQMLDFVTGAAFGKGQFRPWVNANGQVDPDLFSKYLNSIGMRIEEVPHQAVGFHLTSPETAARIKSEGFEKVYGEQGRFVFVYAPGMKVPDTPGMNQRTAVDVNLSGLKLLPGEEGMLGDTELPADYDGFLVKRDNGDQFAILKADVAERQRLDEMAGKVINRTMANVVNADIKGYLPKPRVEVRPGKKPGRYVAPVEPFMGLEDYSFKFMDNLVGKKYVSVDLMAQLASGKNINQTEARAIKNALVFLPDEFFTAGKGRIKKVTTTTKTKAVKKWNPETKTLETITPEKVSEEVRYVPQGQVAIKPMVDWIKTNFILPTRMRMGATFRKGEIQESGSSRINEVLDKFPGYKDLKEDDDIMKLFIRPKYLENTPQSSAVIGDERFEAGGGRGFYPGYNNEPELDIFKDHNINGSQNMGMINYALIHETDAWDESAAKALGGNHNWNDYTKGYFGHTRASIIPNFQPEKYMEQLPPEMQVNAEEMRIMSPIVAHVVNELQNDSAQLRGSGVAEIEKLSPVTKLNAMYREQFKVRTEQQYKVNKAQAKLEFMQEELPELARRTVNEDALKVIKIKEGKWQVSTEQPDWAGYKTDNPEEYIDGIYYKRSNEYYKQRVKDLESVNEAKSKVRLLEKYPALAEKYEVGKYGEKYGIYRKQPLPEFDEYGGGEVGLLREGGSEDPQYLYTEAAPAVSETFRTKKAAEEFVERRTITDDYVEKLADKYRDAIIKKDNKGAVTLDEAKNFVENMATTIRGIMTPGKGIQKHGLKRTVEVVQRDHRMAKEQMESAMEDMAEEILRIQSAPTTPQDIAIGNKLQPYMNNYEGRALKDYLAFAEEQGADYVILPYAETVSWGQRHTSYKPNEKAAVDVKKLKTNQTNMIPSPTGGGRRSYVVTKKTKDGGVEAYRTNNESSYYNGMGSAMDRVARDIDRLLTKVEDEEGLKGLPPEIRAIAKKKTTAGVEFIKMLEEQYGTAIIEELTEAEIKKIKKMTSDGEIDEFISDTFFGYDEPLEQYREKFEDTGISSDMLENLTYDADARARGSRRDEIAPILAEKIKTTPDLLKLENEILEQTDPGYEMIYYKKTVDSDGDAYDTPYDRYGIFKKSYKETIPPEDLKGRKFDPEKDLDSSSYRPIYEKYVHGNRKTSYPNWLDKFGIRNAIFKASEGFRYVLIPTSKRANASIKGYDTFKDLDRIAPALLPFVLGLEATQEQMEEEPQELGSR